MKEQRENFGLRKQSPQHAVRNGLMCKGGRLTTSLYANRRSLAQVRHVEVATHSGEQCIDGLPISHLPQSQRAGPLFEWSGVLNGCLSTKANGGSWPRRAASKGVRGFTFRQAAIQRGTRFCRDLPGRRLSGRNSPRSLTYGRGPRSTRRIVSGICFERCILKIVGSER